MNTNTNKSYLEEICAKNKAYVVRKINVAGKDFGILRKNIDKDFEILIYDLDSRKRAGKSEFFISSTGLSKEYYVIDILDSKAYYEKFDIKSKYRGLGLSKILLEESVKVLKEKKMAHIVKFMTPEGKDRLSPQFIKLGYKIAAPIGTKYPLVAYKKY